MNSTGDHVMQMPWTYAGWPCLSIPTGKVDGLPVAVQLIAPPDADEVLLQLGAELEPVLTPPDFFQEAAADTKL